VKSEVSTAGQGDIRRRKKGRKTGELQCELNATFLNRMNDTQMPNELPKATLTVCHTHAHTHTHTHIQVTGDLKLSGLLEGLREECSAYASKGESCMLQVAGCNTCFKCHSRVSFLSFSLTLPLSL